MSRAFICGTCGFPFKDISRPSAEFGYFLSDSAVEMIENELGCDGPDMPPPLHERLLWLSTMLLIERESAESGYAPAREATRRVVETARCTRCGAIEEYASARLRYRASDEEFRKGREDGEVLATLLEAETALSAVGQGELAGKVRAIVDECWRRARRPR